MYFQGIQILLTALALATTYAIPVGRDSASPPCASIASAYQQALNSNKTSQFTVPGQQAHDCLQSMPFRSDLGASFLDELRNYLQFQSTIDVLKNPPSTYLSPAVDLFGGLDQIYNKTKSSGYTSQFEFDADISTLIASANDGHLYVTLCSQAIFQFEIPLPVVSISDNGLSLPKIYATTDAALAANSSEAVSSISMINGQDVVQYFMGLGLTQGNQDPDAQYNDVFVSLPKTFSKTPEMGAWASNSGKWPGAAVYNITFANGTNLSVQTVASISGNIANFNITDGQSLFNAACLPSQSPSPNSTGTVATPKLTGPANYPDPIIRDPFNLISGYFLEENDLEDVAALFVPTFGSYGTETLPDDAEAITSIVAGDLITNALAAGKKRLIIDVSGNPGGLIIAAFDLFKLFFPNVPAYSATRFRDNEAVNFAGQIYGAEVTKENITQDSTLAQLPIIYEAAVSPDQKSGFNSWNELYGPHLVLGSNLSSLYANFNYTAVSSYQQPIHGYGVIPDVERAPPFSPENIIIVTDGFCSSSCATFTNLMVQMGVRTVAFGGRPVNKPMQAIGGVRGAQSVEFEILAEWITTAYQQAVESSNTSKPLLTSSQLQRFNQTRPKSPQTLPLYLPAGDLNFRNSYQDDNDSLPLQFAYKAADCKLFFTWENLAQPATAWSAAAKAIWQGQPCVQGSTSTGNSTNKA